MNTYTLTQKDKQRLIEHVSLRVPEEWLKHSVPGQYVLRLDVPTQSEWNPVHQCYLRLEDDLIEADVIIALLRDLKSMECSAHIHTFPDNGGVPHRVEVWRNLLDARENYERSFEGELMIVAVCKAYISIKPARETVSG